MKLDRTFVTAALAVVLTACGAAQSPAPASANVASGATRLTSAVASESSEPAPKVGKSQRTLADASDASDEAFAPKDPPSREGSRKPTGFGVWK